MVTRDEIIKAARQIPGTYVINLDPYLDSASDRIASQDGHVWTRLTDVKSGLPIHTKLVGAVNAVRLLQHQVQCHGEPTLNERNLVDEDYRFVSSEANTNIHYYFSVDAAPLVDDIVRSIIMNARKEKACYLLIHASEKYESCLLSIRNVIYDVLSFIAPDSWYNMPIASFHMRDYDQNSIDESFIMSFARVRYPRVEDGEAMIQWAAGMIDILNPLFRKLRNETGIQSSLVREIIDDATTLNLNYRAFSPGELIDALNQYESCCPVSHLRNIKTENPANFQRKMVSRTCGIITPDINGIPSNVEVMKFKSFFKNSDINSGVMYYHDNIDDMFLYAEMISNWLVHHPIGFVQY